MYSSWVIQHCKHLFPLSLAVSHLQGYKNRSLHSHDAPSWKTKLCNCDNMCDMGSTPVIAALMVVYTRACLRGVWQSCLAALRGAEAMCYRPLGAIIIHCYSCIPADKV